MRSEPTSQAEAASSTTSVMSDRPRMLGGQAQLGVDVVAGGVGWCFEFDLVERVAQGAALSDGDVSRGVEDEHPAAVVGGVMVVVAEQDQIPRVRRSAVAPVLDVVDLGPAAGHRATGPAAVLVADEDEGAHGGGDDAGAPADVDRLPLPGEDRQQMSVAGQPAGGGHRGGAGPVEPRPPGGHVGGG